MHQKVINSKPNHPSYVNNAYGPKPPTPDPFVPHFHDGFHHILPPPNPKTWAYYGSWEAYKSFVDTNQFCAAAPGVSSGLYHPDGPLNLGLAQHTPLCLTGVNSKAEFSLLFSFNYSNPAYDKTIELKTGKLYNLIYLENGQLKRCHGKCVDIWKIYSSDETSSYYKIKFDCSVNYANQTVIVKNDQIRGLSVYTGYEDESTTIDNSLHKYGTTTGSINGVIITNATMDANGNIIEGDIINGSINGYTIDGLATGTNDRGLSITTVNSRTKDGIIISGKILTALFAGGSIDGKLDEETGITEKATIRGNIINAIVQNSSVEGGKSTNGTIVDPTITNGILYNAVITGNDMVTTGGITIGNITTGGTTVGGTAVGGTSVGTINGQIYTIEEGTTSSVEGKELTTNGGVVVGGTVIGGVREGNIIIGAIVKGGVASNGITINGTTTGGTLIPTPQAQVPLTRNIYQNQQFLDIDPNTNRGLHNNQPSYTPDHAKSDPMFQFDNPMYPPPNGGRAPMNPPPPSREPSHWTSNHLVIKHDLNTNQIDTNFGRATMQDIPQINSIPNPLTDQDSNRP